MASADQRISDRAPSSATPELVGDLGLALVISLGAVGATWWLLPLPATYLALGAVVYASIALLVGRMLPAGSPGPGIGAANRVTLGRAALAVPVVALALQPGPLGVAGRWWIIAISTVVLVLDGVDGRVARRTGTQTEFGARFDMELDAVLILALSVLVWRSGRVGSWVLLIGLMRYLFVAAGRVWPALQGELPPSLRRKAVCVTQGVVLLVALGPIVPQWMAITVAAGGLIALTYSFVVDVHWTLSHRRPSQPGT